MAHVEAGSAAERLRSLRADIRVGVRAGRPILVGEHDWVFRGSPAEVEQLQEALPGICQALGHDTLLLRFGNRVGIFDLPVLGVIEVVAGKWDERHFDRMLRDLTRICVNLPFAGQDSAALPYDRSVAQHEDVLYHAFVYLRYVLSDLATHEDRLDTALELVLRNPHVRWRGVQRAVPLDRLHRVGPETVLALATGSGRELKRVFRVPGAPEIVEGLGDYLPATVPERRSEQTVDTPENRFVKAFLDQVDGILGRIARSRPPGGTAFTDRIAREAGRLQQSLTPIRRHALWHDVGPMTHLPTGSTVLQRRRGYDQILRHFSRLRLAVQIPLDADRAKDLLEAKDIALLYELWTFFKVAEALTELLGKPRSAERARAGDFEVDVPWDFEIRWDRVILTFNAHFSRSRPTHRRSYSTPLRPDIVLEVSRNGSRELHVLDAKFRVDRPPTPSQLQKGSEPRELDDEEEHGTFKRVDLYKMHTYRDAIPNARSAWILYPGSEFRFFPVRAAGPAHAPVELSSVDGVGAIPTTPVGDREMLLGMLARLTGPAH